MDAQPTSFRDRLGLRGTSRAAPRFGVAVGAAGAALAVVGGIVVGGDRLVQGGSDGSPDAVPGTLMTLVLVAGGYALLAVARRDAPRAAGATASMLALPALLFFLTFDTGHAPPFSVDAILLVPTLLWGLAYVVGPSTGRPVYLGAALIGVWLFVIEQVESVFSAPFFFLSPIGSPFFAGGSFDRAPDPTTVGVLSFLFGAGYLVVAGMLDNRGLRGAATPFVFVGIVAIANGLGGMADDLEVAGVGVLTAATGVALALYFPVVARRGATWIGGFGVALGAALVIGDVLEDSTATTIGFTGLVVGAVVVILADLVSGALREAPELEPLPAPEDAPLV